MKPINVKSNTNKIGYIVRILKYKYIFTKAYTPN